MKSQESNSLNQILAKNLQYIYHLRKSQKSEFSAELGIGSTTLQNILSGNSNVTLNTLELMAARMDISPLLLLSDQYNSQELGPAFLLLRTLDCFCALSQEDRAKAAALFCELVEILSNSSSSQKQEGQTLPDSTSPSSSPSAPPLLPSFDKNSRP